MPRTVAERARWWQTMTDVQVAATRSRKELFPCITGASATPELRGLVCGFVGSEAYRPGSGRRDWPDGVPHGCRRGQYLMVLTGRKSGRDLVIERVLPSVDALGVDDADPSQPAVRSGGLRREHRRVRLSPS